MNLSNGVSWWVRGLRKLGNNDWNYVDFFPAAVRWYVLMVVWDFHHVFFFRWKPTQMGETTNQKSTNRRRIAPVYPPENSHIPPKILLKMIFLLSRWDMLVRWRVSIFASKTIHNRRWVIYYWRLPCGFPLSKFTVVLNCMGTQLSLRVLVLNQPIFFSRHIF